MDLRKMRDVIVDAVREENDRDPHWGWHVKGISKKRILIRWGYLDLIGQKGDFSIRAWEEGNDISLIGCMDDNYSKEWFLEDDADDLFVWVGEKHWHDAKTVDDGIRMAVRQLGRLAHVRY